MVEDAVLFRDVVADLIGGRANRDTAVARFAAPFRAHRDGPADRLEELAWTGFGEVAAAARTVAVHDALVALLTGVRDLGPLTGADDAVRTVWTRRLFTDLPCLGPQLRESLDVYPDDCPALFAFARRLTRAGLGDFSAWESWERDRS